MQTALIQSAEELQLVAPAWRALAKRCRLQSVFQLADWVLPWCATFGPGRALMVLATVDRRGLVAILPLQIGDDHHGRLQFIGTPLNDRNAMLVADEDRRRAWASALQRLLVERGWDRGVLTEVADPDLQVCAATRRPEVALLAPEPSPVLHLPGTWAQYQDRLPSHQRHRWLRQLARLQEAHDVRLRVRTGSEVGPEDLVAFHDRRSAQWRAQGRMHLLSMAERDGSFGAFLVRAGPGLARRGHLALASLEVDGWPAASCLYFLWGTTALDYMGTYEVGLARYAPGMLLTLKAIEWMIGQGFRTYDFGRGDEPYKFRLLAVPRLLGGVELRPGLSLQPTSLPLQPPERRRHAEQS
jgi:CelD/BcsL family acetyltransferase involved in cellulose biosynthesis